MTPQEKFQFWQVCYISALAGAAKEIDTISPIHKCHESAAIAFYSLDVLLDAERSILGESK